MRSILICLLTITLGFSSFAQNMETLFYGRSWSEVPSLLDSIKQVLPTFYVRDSSLYKNDKGVNYNLESTEDKDKVIIVKLLKFKSEKETIGTVEISGPFESLLRIYYKYVLRSFHPQKKDNNCWPVIVKNTVVGRMPISFCQFLSYDPKTWTIENKIPL